MKSNPFSKNSALRPHPARRWLNSPWFPACPIALGACFLFVCGCTKIEPPQKISITEAQKKFEQKCRKEFDLNVITRMVGKTLWIYSPMHDPIFDYAAEKPGAEDAQKKPAKYDLRFLNGSFQDNSFHFEYDIINKTKSDLESYGIRNEAAEKFNKIYQNIFTAIAETLFGLPQKPISFVVIVITDIKKGIEVRYTFYLHDYEESSTEIIPYDELTKRILQDSRGNTAFIGDEIGSHLEYTDILMPDFLVKQMINRIRFKFTQSDFAPQEDYENVIIGIIADTTRYYKFEDFKEVATKNLRTSRKMVFTREQLKSFGEDKPLDPAQQGKLIHIRFDNGEIQMDEPATTNR